MKTFCGSLLVFVMSVQGLLLSSTLHANSSVYSNHSKAHFNHTKVEPDILMDSIMFCWKQVPNSDESTLDTGFNVVATMAFDELIRYIDGGKKSSFGSPTSKSFVRDFAKLPSTWIKVKQGLKKGSTDEKYDEGHLWSQSIKVLAKGGVLLIAGAVFKCEPEKLELIAEGVNYPADYVSQLLIITSKKRQKAIKAHEIEEDVDYQTYLFEHFGLTLLLEGVETVAVRTGAVQLVSLYLLKKFSVPNLIYWSAFQIPNYLFGLGFLNPSNSLHSNIQVLENSKVRYVHSILVAFASHFIATYVRETVNSYILIPVGQVAVNSRSAIWEYEHPIKDSMKESYEYYSTLVNENIIEPFYKYQADESFSDDDDYTSDL